MNFSISWKAIGVLLLLISVSLSLFWVFIITGEQFPELYTSPVRNGFKILAELVLVLFLLVGSLGLITGKKWAPTWALFSLGMLFYASLDTIGIFGQRSGTLGMFAMLVMAIISVFLFVKKK